MRTTLFTFLAGCILLHFLSCSKFLDEKSDMSLATPDQVKDLQALLDDESIMTQHWPGAGDIAADFYFLTQPDWASRNEDVRNTYVWDPMAQNRQEWNTAYQRIFISNVVIDEIDNARLGQMTEVDRKEIKGRAYFFRGFCFMHLSQLYAPHYTLDMTDSEYGLPLKIKSDINEPVQRSTVSETYQQIIQDLNDAVELLPERSTIATRPSKVAALAVLARLYLIIGDYRLAFENAQKSLSIQSELLDYNELNSSANQPFEILNKEVLFHATITSFSSVHNQSRAFVDSTIVHRYDVQDLRSSLFLRRDPTGHYRFKGSYSGSLNTLFGGIAVDEVYLIKAEAQARLGMSTEALATMNELLSKRWIEGTYKEVAGLTGDALLAFILSEREKELLFRGGLRWSDLRRFNHEGKFVKTIQRQIGDTAYELLPNDMKYVFLIPFETVEISGLQQNER